MDQGQLENVKVQIKNGVKEYAKLVAGDIAELFQNAVKTYGEKSWKVEKEDEDGAFLKLKEKYNYPEFAAILIDFQDLLDKVDLKQTEIILARQTVLDGIVENYFRPEPLGPTPEVYE